MICETTNLRQKQRLAVNGTSDVVCFCVDHVTRSPNSLIGSVLCVSILHNMVMAMVSFLFQQTETQKRENG
jgi:hypothetical protein